MSVDTSAEAGLPLQFRCTGHWHSAAGPLFCNVAGECRTDLVQRERENKNEKESEKERDTHSTVWSTYIIYLRHDGCGYVFPISLA